MTIQSLAEFKRCMSNGMGLELVKASERSNGEWHDWTTHKWIGSVRKAEKVQTQSVRLEGGSWLYFDKASNWQFRDGIAEYTDDRAGVKLTYKIKQ